MWSVHDAAVILTMENGAIVPKSRKEMNEMNEKKRRPPRQAGHPQILRAATTPPTNKNSISHFQRRKKLRPTGKTYFLLTGLIAVLAGVVIHLAGQELSQKSVHAQPVVTPASTADELLGIDVNAMAKAWAYEGGFDLRYELTNAERLLVAQVVMAEASGEPYAGKVAVAQCILNACELNDIRPAAAVSKYKYATGRPEPSQEAWDAVSAVFDRGFVVANEPILYFYNPKKVDASFHESQVFVIEINNHRFFKEAH